MKLTTLGTSCAQQTPYRTQSSNALTFSPAPGSSQETYLFDVGSSTGTSLLKSGIKLSSITKIFITHLHADHVAGLPSLLTDILGGHGATQEELRTHTPRKREPHHGPRRAPLEIYGLKGVRELIRVSFRVTYTNPLHPFRITELLLPEDDGTPSAPPTSSLHLNELSSRDLVMGGGSGCWEDICPRDEQARPMGRVRIKAVPIVHTVPSLAYVLIEPDHTIAVPPPTTALLQAHFSGRELGRQLAILKRGGRVLVDQKEQPEGRGRGRGVLVEALPQVQGRIVVICGDTSDASSIASVIPNGRTVSLLLHESTNLWVPPSSSSSSSSSSGGPSLVETRKKARSRGHSTADGAGALARRVAASCLVLTHFSTSFSSSRNRHTLMPWCEETARLGARCSGGTHHGDGDGDEEGVTQEELSQRWEEVQRPSWRKEDVSEGMKVIAAWDGMVVDVPPTGRFVAVDHDDDDDDA